MGIEVNFHKHTLEAGILLVSGSCMTYYYPHLAVLFVFLIS